MLCFRSTYTTTSYCEEPVSLRGRRVATDRPGRPVSSIGTAAPLSVGPQVPASGGAAVPAGAPRQQYRAGSAPVIRSAGPGIRGRGYTGAGACRLCWLGSRCPGTGPRDRPSAGMVLYTGTVHGVSYTEGQCRSRSGDNRANEKKRRSTKTITHFQ